MRFVGFLVGEGFFFGRTARLEVRVIGCIKWCLLIGGGCTFSKVRVYV